MTPFYPPSATALTPPSLPQRQTGRRGKGGRQQTGGFGASRIPPARVSPHDSGSAMSSPVTLPFMNLEDKKKQPTNKQEISRVT